MVKVARVAVLPAPINVLPAENHGKCSMYKNCMILCSPGLTCVCVEHWKIDHDFKSLVTVASLPLAPIPRRVPTLAPFSKMSDVPQLLLASLSPSTRKQAEQSLATHSTQASFPLSLLRIALDSSQDRSVRLAGSVYLKNTIKSRWEDVSGKSISVL